MKICGQYLDIDDMSVSISKSKIPINLSMYMTEKYIVIAQENQRKNILEKFMDKDHTITLSFTTTKFITVTS